MINIESSYRPNEIGRTLYELVLDVRPETIVEFGVLNGYSSICMAMALKELGRGKVIAYDLWDDYEYNHGNQETVMENLEMYGVEEYVELRHGEFDGWLKNPIPFDLIHIDISNDGNTILAAYEALKESIEAGSVMAFEGGTEERDGIEWMIRFGKVPICSVKDRVDYAVLDAAFPSLSVIKR